MSQAFHETGDDPARAREHAVRPSSNHLVVTVHGIRTYGGWQADLKRLLEAAEPGVIVRNFQYGYFSAIAFLVPCLRWIVGRRFRKFLVHEVRSMPPDARIDLVAHSFGTYLVVAALKSLPEGRRINTIILSGSVLRPTFPWYKYQATQTVGRVVNECGWDDNVLLLCQSIALWLGMAGRVGFQGMVGTSFVNRFYRGGHGLYFDRDQRFMRERWLPLLTSDTPIDDVDERPVLTAWGGTKLFLMNNMQVIKVTGAIIVALALVLIPIDWMRKADFQRRVERFSHIAMLANAEQIPRRDPEHIRELLRVDVRSHDGGDSNERSLNQLFSADAISDGDDPLAEDSPEPYWWNRIPGLRDENADAVRARLKHAQANSQLVASKAGRERDLSKAKLRFEEAIQAYRRVKDTDPTYGSYALCLIDYGLVLTEMGALVNAVEQFRKVRTDVFPMDSSGKRPGMPASLEVDSLCYEAEALKRLERWEEAKERQLEAERAAQDDKALVSYVCNEIAWLKMERLEVAEAREYFLKSRDACEELIRAGRLAFRRPLFHARHGLAMTERLLGRPDDSYAEYDQIVRELESLLQDDLLFTPKERRDLRDRLVNSMERRADVRLFARLSPSDNGRGLDTVAWNRQRANALRSVIDDYQSTIESVGQDDPATGIRVLYKKVIARGLAQLVSARPAHEPRPRVDELRASGESEAPDAEHEELAPIDIEFAVANRGYDGLTRELRSDLRIYHDIAASLMRLFGHARGDRFLSAREQDSGPPVSSGGFDTKGVSELRALTAQCAQRCERLKRESIEMLLLAMEVLLEAGVEDDPQLNAVDASRMMSVLGLTTKVPSHLELQPYLARFNRLVSKKLAADRSDATGGPETPTPGGDRGLVATAVAEPGVLFYLRLSPRRALRITSEVQHARTEGGTDLSESRFGHARNTRLGSAGPTRGGP